LLSKIFPFAVCLVLAMSLHAMAQTPSSRQNVLVQNPPVQSPPAQNPPVLRPASSLLAPVATQYRLNVGDVLELSVRGFADLRQKAIVEMDGEVALPLAGRVRVIGMPIADAQALIKELVISRPLQQRSPDGRETYVALAADDVNVTIAEFRPVYVSGDVGKPGELPYRPGMSVRQAIALAGGFDIMRYRLVNPFTESADFKGLHESLWTEATRLRVRLARLDAEIEGKTQLGQIDIGDIPLPRDFIDGIVKSEAETLRRRQDDYEKEKKHILALVKQYKDKVTTLTQLTSAEEEGSQADTREYEQMLEFNKRGTVPLSRLMEIRRIQLTSSTRLLQTRVQLDQANRDLSDAERNLDRFDNNYRLTLVNDRQDQVVAYGSLQARIAANADKLQHTSLLKSRLVRGPGAKVKIQIFRSLIDQKQEIPGSEDTPLLPGDTVEISLQNEFDVEANRAD
jgi:polysaccharide export outer membrane protein